MFLLSGAMVMLLLVAALAAPWIAQNDPETMNAQARLAPPSQTYLFGTDQFGRDMFARVLYGSRVSLRVGLIAVLTATVLGGVLGMFTGFYGGWIDSLFMRVMDMMIAFPSLLLALFLVAVLGSGINNLILAISLTRLPLFARLTRSEVDSLNRRMFVESSRSVGAGNRRLMSHHILPNVIPLLVVYASTDIATAILAESSLSYLGLGAQPPTPSWGRMLTEGRGFMGQAPWLAVFPGLAIMLTVISFNLLGDSLRDILDPRLRH
jgi:peptide/nickel transport system permease protein